MEHNHKFKKKIEFIGINKIYISLIAIYILICTFEHYINLRVGNITKYFALLIMSSFFLCVYKQKINISFNIFHLSFFTWLMLEMISIFWSPGQNQINNQLFGRISIIIFLFILTSINYSKKCINIFINSLYLSNIFMSFLFVMVPNCKMSVGGVRYTFSLFGIYADPNNIAAFVILGGAIALYKLMFEKKNSIFHLFNLIIALIALFLTGSRAGFITLILIIISIILYKKNFRLEKISKIFLKFSLLLVLGYILIIIMNSINESNVLDRIFNFDSYEGGSERSAIWKLTLEDISQRLLLGYGWGSYASKSLLSIGIHNTYFVILYEVGVVGLIFILLGILFIVLKAKKNKLILPLILLISGLIPSFFIDASNKRFFWNAIIFSYIYSNQYNENISAQHQNWFLRKT